MRWYVVYGYEHPAFDTRVLGRYRWRWLADFNAWMFRAMSTLWPNAWVEEEEEVLN